METLAIYAIAAGGLFLVLFLLRTRSILIHWTDFFSVLLSRHLTLPVLIHRHQLWGPWTRASVLIHVSYVAINVALVFFRTTSFTGAGRRAGELAVINLVFPLSATHLGYLSDLLGITWRTCRKNHHATGWMAVALLSFHSIAEVQDQQFRFPLGETHNLFTVIVSHPLSIITTQLTAVGCYFTGFSCSVFYSILSSMVLRDLSPKPSDLGWPLCLRHLATPSGPQRPPKIVPLHCTKHFGADDMLGTGGPVLSKRAVFGPRCSTGSRIVHFREIPRERERHNGSSDPYRSTTISEG